MRSQPVNVRKFSLDSLTNVNLFHINWFLL